MDAASSAASTYYLLYRSQATEGLSVRDILALLAQAQAYNRHAGITGLLCYSGGLLVQLLESPVEAVHSLYTRIQQDPRRGSCTALLSTVEHGLYRAFPPGMLRAHPSAAGPPQAAGGHAGTH
ncbi:BLUF domain-containing protein [Hymenobacter sediminis]|uniref:BLUF domain-containing protein n=1 Tax=Hymenobacter sediminis TaxID=2218621 RepID=UPI00138FEC24|nr:BLUF domain-containing protein [Hymenobacter sediminis]